MLQSRCSKAGCRNPATLAFKIVTPTPGYPIELGSQCAPYYLTALTCEAHKGALTRDAVAALAAPIRAAFAIKGLVPDLARAELLTVPLDDPEWIEFANLVAKRGGEAVTI